MPRRCTSQMFQRNDIRMVTLSARCPKRFAEYHSAKCIYVEIMISQEAHQINIPQEGDIRK